jgi:hypothetical protein
MEYCLTIKKNKIISLAGKWLELDFMLSKMNQTQKVKYPIFSLLSGVSPLSSECSLEPPQLAQISSTL